MPLRALAAASLFALPILAAGPAEPAPILLTQVPRGLSHRSAAAPGSDGDLAPGTRIVLVDRSEATAQVSVLTGGFTAAGRPALSADAQRMLFVARQTADEPLAVWEMELATGTNRRIAGCDGDCTRAIYASVLYSIDLDQSAEMVVVSARPRPAADPSRSALHAVRADGSVPRRITFNPLGASHPRLLRDGRIVFSSGTGGKERQGAALLTVHVDGMDVFSFTAPPPPGVRQTMPCQAAGGDVIFVESDSRDGFDGGALVSVSSTRSRTERRVLGAASGGRFHSPAPLLDGSLLVAWRPERGGSYGIYRLDPGGDGRIEPVFDAKDREDLDPVAVVPWPVPSGRSSSVKESVPYGELYGLDARLGDEGEGARLPVAALTVWRAPDGGSGDVLLGRVPVEADGSFYLRVPSRVPLRLEAVDPGGNVIRAMSSWIWVMPNEKRGCIGCHEDRDLAPPNRHALALRRPPRSVGLSEAERGNVP